MYVVHILVGQPCCMWLLECTYTISGLFGEGPADRRERLRQLIAEIGELPEGVTRR